MTGTAETFQFQAETRQLLDLMIHSLYSNKEIFLRELISNASDAIDRYRFESLTDTALNDDRELEIRLESDPELRTLTIHDTGIGMSRDEVIRHIGTIAKSGTKELLQKIKEEGKASDAESLIGQFGVGFYSSFMVANNVILETRRAGEEKGVRWESKGDGEYTLEETERSKSGTSITLFLKEVDTENGIDDFTSFYVLDRIVKRYSDFVRYPIKMEQQREEPTLDEEGNIDEDAPKQVVVEDKTLNSMKPLWMRSQSEVTDEEYAQFYKQIAHAWDDPLETIPLSVEGRLEYKALLYLPKKAPFDLYHHVGKRGLKLYVRNVLIMEHCEDLLPKYLRFVQGIVDSSDLQLNVSREMIQQSRSVAQIKKYLTKKVLDTLTKMSEKEEEKYLSFWKEFARTLKEGVTSDFDNKDKLVNLLMFDTSENDSKPTTLAAYKERMKEGQEAIYYQTGQSRTEIETSPHLEAFQDKGIEVLYLTDPIDEIVLNSVFEFEELKFQSVGKGEVELGSEEEKKKAKEELEEKEKEFKDFLSFLKDKLSDSVKEVRLSSRLTNSPACLVGSQHDYSPHLERFLRSEQENVPSTKRTLELNPGHPMIQQFRAQYKSNEASARWDDYAELLLGYAMLAEGSKLPDPGKFNQLVVDLMNRELLMAN